MKKFIWTTRALAEYKKARDRMMGDTFTSKFSMWLAFGCITPKQIVREVVHFEKEKIFGKVRNESDQLQSTYWLIFELLWRDFTTLAALKAGKSLFDYGGIQKMAAKWGGWGFRNDSGPVYKVLNNKDDFSAWCQGKTGFPLIDASMRELLATGWTSNRGRQNVASFLIYHLGIDWRWGAEWFEHCLIDHQVGANYVNWQTIAGIGYQIRDNIFNCIEQGVKYEPGPKYYKKWIPELSDCPSQYIHTPWDCPKDNSANFDPSLWRQKMIRSPTIFHYDKTELQTEITTNLLSQLGMGSDAGIMSNNKVKHSKKEDLPQSRIGSKKMSNPNPFKNYVITTKAGVTNNPKTSHSKKDTPISQIGLNKMPNPVKNVAVAAEAGITSKSKTKHSKKEDIPVPQIGPKMSNPIQNLAVIADAEIASKNNSKHSKKAKTAVSQNATVNVLKPIENTPNKDKTKPLEKDSQIGSTEMPRPIQNPSVSESKQKRKNKGERVSPVL